MRIVRGKEDIVLAPTMRTSFLPAPQTTSTDLPTTRVRCHNCLASGHTSAACPLRFCARCNLYGHTCRQCTQQKSGQREWRRATEHPPSTRHGFDEEEPVTAVAVPPYDATDPRNSVDTLIQSLAEEVGDSK